MIFLSLLCAFEGVSEAELAGLVDIIDETRLGELMHRIDIGGAVHHRGEMLVVDGIGEVGGVVGGEELGACAVGVEDDVVVLVVGVGILEDLVGGVVMECGSLDDPVADDGSVFLVDSDDGGVVAFARVVWGVLLATG